MAIKVPKTETANKILVILRDRIATPRVKINLLRISLPNTRKRAKRS